MDDLFRNARQALEHAEFWEFGPKTRIDDALNAGEKAKRDLEELKEQMRKARKACGVFRAPSEPLGQAIERMIKTIRTAEGDAESINDELNLTLCCSPRLVGEGQLCGECIACLKIEVDILRRKIHAALLFHSPGPWDDAKRADWEETTGTEGACTKSLCDFLRSYP